MDADMKLDGEALVLEGNWTRLRSWDLVLDGDGRRSTAAGDRRALVHGSDDQLIVNFRGDYPRGVRIEGSVQLPDRVTVGEQRTREPDRPASWRELLDEAVRIRSSSSLVRDLARPPRAVPPPAGLQVHTSAEFHGLLRTHDVVLRDGDTTSSLKATIAGLLRTVEALEARIAALESR